MSADYILTRRSGPADFISFPLAGARERNESWSGQDRTAVVGRLQ